MPNHQFDGNHSPYADEGEPFPLPLMTHIGALLILIIITWWQGK